MGQSASLINSQNETAVVHPTLQSCTDHHIQERYQPMLKPALKKIATHLLLREKLYTFPMVD